MAGVNGKTTNGEIVTINLKKTHLIISIFVIILVGSNAAIGIITQFTGSTRPVNFDWEPFQNAIRQELDTLTQKMTYELDKHVNDEGAHKWILRELRENDLKDIRDHLALSNKKIDLIISRMLPQAKVP